MTGSCQRVRPLRPLAIDRLRRGCGILIETCGWLLLFVSVMSLALGLLLLALPIPVLVVERPQTAMFAALFFSPVVLILLSIGLIPWGASLRRQHVAHGHCRACGYDLQAQRAGRSCPECGTVI